VSEARSVFGHSTVYASTAILNRGAGLLLLPLYTQFLDPSDYGTLGLITITSEVVGAMIGVKLGTAMSRLFFDYAAEHEREELVSTAILGLGSIVAACTVLLALVAGPLAAMLLGNRDQGGLLFLGVVGFLLNVIFMLGVQYLTVLQRSTAVLTVTTLRSVLYLGLGALFIAWLSLGVFGALLAILLANAFAVAWLILPLMVRIGVRFSRAKFVAMLAFGAPLLPGQLAELLLRFSDRFLLGQLASLASAGVFFLGLRLSTTLPMALVSPFNQIFIVRRFDAHGRNDDDSEATRVFTYFFAILVSAALGLSLVAPQLIALVAFGRPDYYGAASVIPLLALAEVVRSILLMSELGLFYAKLPRALTLASIAGLLVHIPLTAGMITMFGAVGAAGAAVLSTTFRLAVTCRLARGLKAPRPQWAHLLVILGAAGAAFGAAWAIDQAVGPAWGVVGRLLLVVAFPVLLFLSPVFGDGERQSLRSFVADRLALRT
jgi:O-antigen/teichoic acid export membrane protein